MQVQWWGYHEVMGTVKPCHEVVRILKLYLMQKHLLELSALTGGGDTSTHTITLTVACAITHVLVASHCVLVFRAFRLDTEVAGTLKQ